MVSTQKREEAINWLNSKSRAFEEGVAILEESGYKPGVVRRLKTIGETPVNREHLIENIRQYLRHLGEEVEDTDADMGVINGEEPQVLVSENDGQDSLLTLADKVEAGEKEGFDAKCGELLITYAKAYREREQGHRMLAEVPEDNTEENVAKRKEIGEDIDRLTDKLERIYPLIKNYIDNGVVPSDEDATEATQPIVKVEENIVTNDNTADLDTLTKEELQKMLKSAKTKILRKSNMLLYQQETKAEQENPLPECPKRTKYETAIAELQKEVEQLEYAIARKG